MITELHIQNLILADRIRIAFGSSFNVLSGETGSGKSAIMSALALVLGARAEVQMIRRGAKSALIEAVFDISENQVLLTFLEQSGINIEEALFIRREISESGKNKIYINHSPATLSLLKEIGKYLVNFIGQHANQQLFSIDYHRHVVDIYGDLEELRAQFADSWKKEKELQNEIEKVKREEKERYRELEVCKMEIDEIEEVAFQEGEEETLFEDYTKLTQADELHKKTSQVYQLLQGDNDSALSKLSNCLTIIDHKELSSIKIELEEIAYNLVSEMSALEFHPQKAEEINIRLTSISNLKKKYGASYSEVCDYLQKRIERKDYLENAEQNLESLEKELKKVSNQSNAFAQLLTKKRKTFIIKLESSIQEELRVLHMPEVEFKIELTNTSRTFSGDDQIEFFMAPNKGEAMVPIKECASGGELSRLLLAVQVLLMGKDCIPSIVFDEVDANIGGKTAVSVGKKLHDLGKKHQVICITHFPQVASQAEYHFQISKVENQGRTVTEVKGVSAEEREEELQRMVGV